jgi:hypothetical protein
MTSITINTANAGAGNSKFDLAAALEQLKAFLVPDTQPAARKTSVERVAKAPSARKWNAVSIECDGWLNFTRG